METEIMVENIHDDILEQYGTKYSVINYDRIKSYSLYKPHNNIEQIVENMRAQGRRMAKVNNLAYTPAIR